MKVVVIVRGRQHEWGVDADLSKSQVDEMRQDGIEVSAQGESVPMLVAQVGMAAPWVFVQRIWNFKNPFGMGP